MTTTDRGQIPIPVLDDRAWSDLVEEATARIKLRVPRWTDTAPGDLGVALVDLFAWLVEGLIFRLDQVPDKNYVAFLNLLGVTRTPPREARTRMTFAVSGPTSIFQSGDPPQLEARQTDGSAPIIFELEEPVSALRWVSLIQATSTANAIPTSSQALQTLSQSGEALPVLPFPSNIPSNGDLWLCAATPAIQGDTVAVWLPEVRVSTDGVTAEWLRLDTTWVKATVESDTTQSLTQTGVVELGTSDWQLEKLSWAPADASTTPYYWFALHLHNAGTATAQLVGAPKALLNSGDASTTLTVTNEQFGVSDGSAFQTFALAHWPVFIGEGLDPFASLSVTVTPVNGTPTQWTVSDATATSTEDAGNVCQLLAATGQISFGTPPVSPGDDGTSSPGPSIPPAGAVLTIARYRYISAGAAGNIPESTISDAVTNLAGVTGVGNPFAASGGLDEESIDDAKARAPQLLRSRDRAVTTEDYERLALDASPEISSACCLGPQIWNQPNRGSILGGQPANFAGLNRASGCVTLIVVPEDVASELMPTATPELLERVRRYLGQRQPAGASLDVRAPFYLPVLVVLKVSIWSGSDLSQSLPASSQSSYVTMLTAAITNYLHPTRGGLDGRGFTVGQRVHVQDIYEALATLVPREVGFVANIKIYANTPPPYFAGMSTNDARPVDLPTPDLNPDIAPIPTTTSPGAGVVVQATDYELICSHTSHVVEIVNWPSS